MRTGKSASFLLTYEIKISYNTGRSISTALSEYMSVLHWNRKTSQTAFQQAVPSLTSLYTSFNECLPFWRHSSQTKSFSLTLPFQPLQIFCPGSLKMSISKGYVGTQTLKTGLMWPYIIGSFYNVFYALILHQYCISITCASTVQDLKPYTPSVIGHIFTGISKEQSD